MGSKREPKIELTEQSAQLFAYWLESRVVAAARGDDAFSLAVEPSGKFWLGRLASEATVIASGLGERGDRLDPCAMGIRLLLAGAGPWRFSASVSACVWKKDSSGAWRKTSPLRLSLPIDLTVAAEQSHGSSLLSNALHELTGLQGLSCELRTSIETNVDGYSELTVLLVNTSPSEHSDFPDTNLYECRLQIEGIKTQPFQLESLPDSFRYDRAIAAYAVNCGVKASRGSFETVDVIGTDQPRRHYWGAASPPPDFSFRTMAADPLPSLEALVEALDAWGTDAWGDQVLSDRASLEGWTAEMLAGARDAAGDFHRERERIRRGVRRLESDPLLLRSFRLMNEAILHSANGRYDGWRPFQVGFLVSNLSGIVDDETDVVDVVWFATGGGKTETYLGLLVIAALYGRLSGRVQGIVAWSRYPLRMLSLQQTQRVADAMAGAELVRRREGIGGAPFSVGFLVGQGATPNALKLEPSEWDADIDDPEMPRRYQVLLRCPFCRKEAISMAFDRRLWKLEHRCDTPDCEWRDGGLPFYIVDDEIFRFLPTVVIGTLDKAALIAFQAGMRCLVGPPVGRCSQAGHGFLYAPRSSRPTGCLVPGCRGTAVPLPAETSLAGPLFRLQDELHLLRDSLGAVDAHYEALFDSLQEELGGRRSKILASSATLSGYQKQSAVLYQREARVFPVPGPSDSDGFWAKPSTALARRFVGVAPRGVTIDFAVDQLLTELQMAVREAHESPERVALELGIPTALINELVSLYGTDVVYGNTLRDLDASLRSIETQIPVKGPLNTATLTGRTAFADVRSTLERLENPELAFDDRLHIVAASSMMSHGVDIDRLNVMVMLGLPLATAEFIQATSRVGRKWPGLVFVMHKIARE